MRFPLPLSFRQSEILRAAQKDGKVEVDALSERFDVSVQTIRRDLAELSDEGRLERVHGGAMLPSGVANIGYQERRVLNAERKADIAKRVAQDIPDGASLFLNIGTSTEAVARALLHHKGLMVVTNNMNVANILVSNEDCEVMVAGGTLRRSDGGLVGDLTGEMIAHFKVDYAVIGASALDEDGDLLDFDQREVGVSRVILRQARKSFLVADASKFRRKAPVRIASLSQIDCFYTDVALPVTLAQKCVAWGTEVCI
jgi:DeoR family glycerol-3-phosphate regulon repressor